MHAPQNYTDALQVVKEKGGYIAMAPGNLLVIANDGSGETAFAESWGHEAATTEGALTEAPEWVGEQVKDAVLNGHTVLDISRVPDAERVALLRTVALIGMPDPSKSADIAALGHLVDELPGGAAFNLPTNS